MNQEICVSIICNVYNHGAYLRDALEGFVSQKTNFKYEILIHDDASTDQSAEIIREFEEKYPDLVKPIYQSVNQYSQNVSITRMIQLPRVRGRYIAMCEGDDYWTDPQKLQKQFDFMEANPEYSLCATSIAWLDVRTGKIRNKCTTVQDRDVSMEEIILETNGRVFQYATIFSKADVFITQPAWATIFSVGDTPLEMYAALCGKIRMLADVTAVYRNHADGSWTARIDRNPQYKIASFQHMINGFTAFNDATDGCYDAVVSKRIRQLKYKIGRLSRDWDMLRSEELRDVYASRRLTAKISDFLYCKAPGLQALIMKLLKV